MSKQIFYLTAALLLVLVQPVGAATDSPWYFTPGGTENVRVNVQYVPEIAGATVETITFNLLVRIP